MVILKTKRLTETEHTTEKILNLLYHLEDLNSYRKNKLNSIIQDFNSIKWKQEDFNTNIF